MRKYTIMIMCGALAACMSACGGKAKSPGATEQSSGVAGIVPETYGHASADSAVMVRPRYAKGYTVTYLPSGVRLVNVSDPQEGSGVSAPGHYALVPRGSAASVPEGYTRIEVPIERAICMTSLQLSNFTALDAHCYVKGITGTKNLFNKDILERVACGETVKIGTEGNFDAEIIIAANPDVIFVSPFKRGGYEVIKETGITLVQHLGYKELDPLGQAEWIKFVAMFIGKERAANETFAGIEARYNRTKAAARGVARRPTVFSGEMHGGNWYAVGGRSYLAQLFRDAGADYVLEGDSNTGGVNIEFERMYSIAADADYWRVLNSYPGTFSYKVLRSSEPRNADFKAFREKKVIYCNMRETPYYELSPVEPDVVLKDLVAIFHPTLIEKDYEPTFYRLLRADDAE